MIYPLYQEIPYQNPDFLFERFASRSGSILLESAELRPGCSRYSFIAVDPFLILQAKNYSLWLNQKEEYGDPLSILAKRLQWFPMQQHENMPPFQGGIAGFFSYEMYQYLEKIKRPAKDDLPFPDLAVGFYDLVIAYDHEKKQSWIFSSGFPEVEKKANLLRAQKRLQWLSDFLTIPSAYDDNLIHTEEVKLQSNFTPQNYCQAVASVKEYIRAGDIFEANISQRFSGVYPAKNGFKLYQQLRQTNPAPFAAYLHFDDMQIISASPERFLKVTGNLVETRPIKGTKKRSALPKEDERLAQELLNSAKDHAENVMIVDLLRNDLSRVCENHSVIVPKLCGLESYATVHHLVSVVQGKLRSCYSALDLLRVAFPGGSITGAPKIRAMEIIAEIEGCCRGPYCGSIGFLSFSGEMDTSITIRSYYIKNNRIYFQVGGAVTLDSIPEEEYEETLVKANALQQALLVDVALV